MKYNIIGDIHGRTCWEGLVMDDCVNIFVGDYFSPYTPMSFARQRRIFTGIVRYKFTHPETVLLIGNHDEDHWHICERYSRHDYENKEAISKLFEDYKGMFDAAYSIENKVLVTHAGVSLLWYLIYSRQYYGAYIFNCNDDHESNTIEEVVDKLRNESFFGGGYREMPGRTYLWNNTFYVYTGDGYEKFSITPDEVSKFVNGLWKSGNYKAFNFRSNASFGDPDGSSERQGPMWIRPEQLCDTNIFKFTNYGQVVGHSMFDHPCTVKNYMNRHVTNDSLNSKEEDKVFFVDCLQYNAESLIFDSDSDTFTINKLNTDKLA